MCRKKSSRGNRLPYSSQEFLTTFHNCVGFIALAGWITIIWGRRMWSWSIITYVPIYSPYLKQQPKPCHHDCLPPDWELNPILGKLWSRTPLTWTTEGTVKKKNQPPVARPRLLNFARLGYVTHLIIYLTLTWPASFRCFHELQAIYVAEVKVRQRCPSEEER
jgi:hypothetical protein